MSFSARLTHTDTLEAVVLLMVKNSASLSELSSSRELNLNDSLLHMVTFVELEQMMDYQTFRDLITINENRLIFAVEREYYDEAHCLWLNGT